MYTAQDRAEAETVRDLLLDKGFRAIVRGEYFPVVGFPVGRTFPSVFVKDDVDFAAARELVERFLAERNEQVPEFWCCPSCGEEHGKQFVACWNCGEKRQNS